MKTISKENVFNSVCRLRSPTFISQIRSRFLFRGRRFQGLCPTCPLFIFFCILINGAVKNFRFLQPPKICVCRICRFLCKYGRNYGNEFLLCQAVSVNHKACALVHKLGIVNAAVGNAYEQLDVIYNGFLLRSVEEAVVAQNTSVVVISRFTFLVKSEFE